MNSDFKKRFRNIFLLKKQGELTEALNLAHALSKDYPEKGAVWGMIGSISWELRELKQASENYKKATLYSPNSEMASIGLFHSLWQLGKVDEAFAEMKRYMTANDSEEYRLILQEIQENNNK